ncbi:MAG: hypothetical protein EBX16_03710 [Burkholderiaceae bacterium]|nr:hypothetical protein [Burkholderiaceae bacterium]
MKTLRVSIGLVISFLVLLPVTSFAQVKPHDASTAAMVELCKSRNDIDAQNFCFGFGEGVYQAYLASRPAGSKPSICFAANNHTREQILDDFLSLPNLHANNHFEKQSRVQIEILLGVHD